MTKLTRRNLFPLVGAGIIATDGSQGATLEQGNPGILIRIIHGYNGWSAIVADHDAMEGYWQPGMLVPVKLMPLQEYLKLIEEVYSA